MSAIPLSSFLGAASQVVQGLMQGKAAGEAAAAEQAQKQQELAAQQAQQRQQQQQFLQELNLHQQQLAAEERHRKEEERLRGVDIERKTAADRFKQQNAGTIAAGKAEIAKARDWRQAQEFAASKKQAALNRYYQTAPNLSQADRDAMWEATQDEISQYETFAGTFASPYATAGQAPAAGGATPPDTGTPAGTLSATGAPAAGTPPAGPVAPRKAPGRLTTPTPSQVIAKEKVGQAGERIAETKKEHGLRHGERKESLAEQRRFHEVLAGGREAALSSIDRHRRVMEQIAKTRAERGPRGSDPKVAALRDATKLEGLFADPKKWPAMNPEMRQAMWDRYQQRMQTLGEKIDPSILKYVRQTVSEPQVTATKGGTDRMAGRRLTQANQILDARDPVTGTLVHNPNTPGGLADRASAFAYKYQKLGPEAADMLQHQYPKDYQHYLQTRPQPAAKPAPAPAAASTPAPRVAGGPPVLPPATGVSVPPPAQTEPPPAPAPAPQRAQPPPQTKQTKQATVHGGYDYSTKQGVPPPKGEDPAVWTAVRRMKPPYPQGTPEWGVWQLFIGQGVEPKAILGALKANPQAMEIARATLHDINQNFLSGPRAAAMQKAAGEGATPGAKAAAPSAGGISFDASVPSSWQRITWPQGTTGVQMTSPGMGVMTVGKARYSFHLKGGKPRIDARL